MSRYYTRVCNFYYGKKSKILVKKKKSLPLNGFNNISFDHIEITFLMPSDSAQMNQQYFDNPVPTDTITLRLSEAPLITGDIYLCPDVIHNNAKDYQSSTDKELKIVLIHSILHLIDYTDDTPESAKVMAEKQHEIYRQLQLNEKT